MNGSKVLPAPAENKLLSTLVVLGLALAMFGMPYDRSFSVHCLYVTVAIAAMDILARLIRDRCLPAVPRRAVRDLGLVGGGLLLLLVSQLYWLSTVSIAPPFDWMSIYLTKNCVFWACSTLLSGYVVLFNVRVLPCTRKVLLLLLTLALAVCAVKGLQQHWQGVGRISLKIGHPVPAGLVFATMTLIISGMALNGLKSLFSYLVITIAFICGSFLVSLTQTRSALIMVLMAAVVIIWKLAGLYRMRINTRPVVSALCLIVIVVVIAFLLNERFHNVYSDLYGYAHGDQGGSLGARLVMWKAGIHSFIVNPWGYSPTDRFAVIQPIIQDMTKNDPAVGSMISGYARHHVHNEIIEVMSLQGIIGLLGVMSFHVAMILLAWRKRIVNDMFRLFVGFLILFGVSDPLFDSDKVGLLVSLAIPLLIIMATSDQRTNSLERRQPSMAADSSSDSVDSTVIRS
ncbi:hypothetical protein R84981_000166 [Carnimonas sp. R-84981]|uniref:O-antigen ligase family protein n=1 Tax=Carnimonas bestiolae TaxID=3402172 RepID=UPI003EDC165F